MLVYVRDSHDFVYRRLVQEGIQAPFDSGWPSNKGMFEPLVHSLLLIFATYAVNVVCRRLQWCLVSPDHCKCPQLYGCEQTICLFIGIGHNHIDSRQDIRFIQGFRGLESVPIDFDGCIQICRGKMARKGKRQAKHCGQLSAECNGAQQPD